MLPRTLKNFNVFVNTVSWAGVASEVNLPKITKKTEGHRGAGMNGEVDLTLGYEKMETEITYAGFDVNQYAQLGVCGAADLPIRFVGLYERQDTCTTQNVEIYMRGNAHEFDPGSTKNGEKTENKIKYGLSYYRLEVDAQIICELDFINGIENFAGNDLGQQIKNLLGL